MARFGLLHQVRQLLADVAHKLNVGAVLEGSVRKDGGHVRITAQLINAVTGFHLRKPVGNPRRRCLAYDIPS
jgi:hypothetical protein